MISTSLTLSPPSSPSSCVSRALDVKLAPIGLLWQHVYLSLSLSLTPLPSLSVYLSSSLPPSVSLYLSLCSGSSTMVQPASCSTMVTRWWELKGERVIQHQQTLIFWGGSSSLSASLWPFENQSLQPWLLHRSPSGCFEKGLSPGCDRHQLARNGKAQCGLLCLWCAMCDA